MCGKGVGGGFDSGISKSENRHLEMDVAPPAIVGRIEIGLDHLKWRYAKSTLRYILN